jgi:small subunit ribosomal protein S13
MARIAWINLPNWKHIEIALTYIFWIWRPLANKILLSVWIEKTRKAESLSEEELDKIRDEIKKSIIEWDLRRDISQNIKRLQEVASYRWSRHKKKLPVRWQRTKTNSRTRKWKATSIANKKK